MTMTMTMTTSLATDDAAAQAALMDCYVCGKIMIAQLKKLAKKMDEEQLRKHVTGKAESLKSEDEAEGENAWLHEVGDGVTVHKRKPLNDSSALWGEKVSA